MKLLSMARAAAYLVSSNGNAQQHQDTTTALSSSASAMGMAGRRLVGKLTSLAREHTVQTRRRLDENVGNGEGDGDFDEDEDANDYEDGDYDGGFDGFDGGQEEGDDYDDQDLFFFDEGLTQAIDDALTFCGIDLDSMRFFDGDDLQLDLELFQYYANLFASECQDDDETTFRTALDNFQTCSSFDLVGALENFDDAIVGAAFECALVSAPAIMEFDNATQLMDFELPYECSEAFLGRNPVGDMIRNTVLHPDKVLPCFQQLAEDIPPCTLEAWPVPVVGPMLQKLSCFIGRQTYFLETVSALNLAAFDECMPDVDQDIDADECDEMLYQCDFIDETEFLLPVPFSDLTKRVAKSSGMTDVIDRYENFFEKCEYERWEGWQYKSKDYTNLVYGGQVPDPGSEPAVQETPPSSPTVKCDDNGQSSVEATAAVSNNGGGKHKSSAGMFFLGMLSGLCMAGLGWAGFAYYRVAQNRRKLRENDIARSKDNLNHAFGDRVEEHTDSSTGNDDGMEDVSHMIFS